MHAGTLHPDEGGEGTANVCVACAFGEHESSSFSPGRPPIPRMLLTFRRAVTSYLRAVTIVAHSFPFPFIRLSLSPALFLSFSLARSLALSPLRSFSAISHRSSPSASLLFAHIHAHGARRLRTHTRTQAYIHTHTHNKCIRDMAVLSFSILPSCYVDASF